EIPLSGNFDQRLELLKKQFSFLVEQKGVARAIISFRKMGHWYLSAMRVSAWLRNEFQTANTPEEFETALNRITEFGPKYGSRDGVLPEFKIPVPSGPVERW
ncbi:MAG: tRNA dihydrouridine synthase DusB, partial [Planctomycetota bacterium]